MLTIISLFFGGAWLWVGVIVYFVITLIFDEIFAETEARVESDKSSFHNALLYATAILMALEMLMLAWFFGTGDFLFIGYALSEFAALDLVQIRQSASDLNLLGLILSVGLVLAGVAGSVGHEFMHRTNSKIDFTIGQLIMSMCLYSAFMFEHVYGHHRNVGFEHDTSTAKRGMGLWFYIFRSITLGNKNAFNIENTRLKRKNKPWYSLSNKVLLGHYFGIIVIAMFFVAAGLQGLLAFLLTTLIAITIIETFNYLSHYGLVRAKGKRIHARHSWNSYNGIFSGLLLNLSRHSNHHMVGGKNYWQLEKEEEGPIVPLAFSLLAVIAVIPPWYHKFMAPSLAYWDKNLASKEELEIISNQKS